MMFVKSFHKIFPLPLDFSWALTLAFAFSDAGGGPVLRGGVERGALPRASRRGGARRATASIGTSQSVLMAPSGSSGRFRRRSSSQGWLSGGRGAGEASRCRRAPARRMKSGASKVPTPRPASAEEGSPCAKAASTMECSSRALIWRRNLVSTSCSTSQGWSAGRPAHIWRNSL